MTTPYVANVAIPHRNYVQRLYKKALRTVFDHYAYERQIYRQHCLLVRQRFDQNANETNPIRIQALVRECEEELELNKHKKPFIYPDAPGGVKHYRNEPVSQWIVDHGQGNWQADPIEFEKIK